MANYDSGDGRWSVRPTSLPTLNFHQFEPHIRFSQAGPYSNNGSKVHVVEVEDHSHPDAPSIGKMGWHKDTGEITGISVHSKYRRLGVAATMFHEAKNLAREHGLTEPVHSDDRTDEGDAWARAVGGTIPPTHKYV